MYAPIAGVALTFSLTLSSEAAATSGSGVGTAAFTSRGSFFSLGLSLASFFSLGLLPASLFSLGLSLAWPASFFSLGLLSLAWPASAPGSLLAARRLRLALRRFIMAT